MHKSLFVLSLGMCSFAAQAQTTEAAPPVSPAVAQPAPVKQLRQGQRDTIDAIGRLYGKRRLGGKIWLGVAGAGTVTTLRAAATPNTTTINGTVVKSETDGGAVATVAGIFIGIPLIVAINKLSTFSYEHQTAIVEAYRNGKALPRKVVRRLSPSYFR